MEWTLFLNPANEFSMFYFQLNAPLPPLWATSRSTRAVTNNNGQTCHFHVGAHHPFACNMPLRKVTQYRLCHVDCVSRGYNEKVKEMISTWPTYNINDKQWEYIWSQQKKNWWLKRRVMEYKLWQHWCLKQNTTKNRRMNPHWYTAINIYILWYKQYTSSERFSNNASYTHDIGLSICMWYNYSHTMLTSLIILSTLNP